jgi:hypothetical protein
MAKRSDDLLYTLPETSDNMLPKPRAELEALLREAHSLKNLESRLKEVKARIVELVQAEGLGAEGRLGARDGARCCIVRWQGGRQSLSRELLIEAGVTPEQLDLGTKQGDGSWICELPAIGESDAASIAGA